MKKNCEYCEYFQCSDTDKLYSCLKHNDLDNNILIVDFDRKTERECCRLDFCKCKDEDVLKLIKKMREENEKVR